MKVTVSEIPDEGLELELTETIQPDAVRIVSPLHARLRFDRRGGEVFVTGDVSSDVELQCGRCLKPFVMKSASQIGVVYHAVESLGRDEHHELKGDELETSFYRNDLIDTDEVLTEQLLLTLPMKPLCSPECKGICPKCGADLNVTSCACAAKEPDPRFEKLKDLLIKGKE